MKWTHLCLLSGCLILQHVGAFSENMEIASDDFDLDTELTILEEDEVEFSEGDLLVENEENESAEEGLEDEISLEVSELETITENNLSSSSVDLSELSEEETNADSTPLSEKSSSLLKNLTPGAPLETPSQISPLESLAIQVDSVLQKEEKPVSQPPSLSKKVEDQTLSATSAIEINLKQVFSGAPIIYSLLFGLSVFSVSIWFYSLLTIRSSEFLPQKLVKDLRAKLVSNQFNEALDLCVRENHFFCKIIASGILSRKHGLTMMFESMKSEGKRATVDFWQRIGLLNDIAIIAPMIGLLGTVVGMFYAFYDLNRSIESVSILFDGLGVSVGTTVAGLIVSIVSMILHSHSRYRLVKHLTSLENETQTFAALIDTRSPRYLETSNVT